MSTPRKEQLTMGIRGSRKHSYKLRAGSSAFNYLLTVPNWVVDMLGVGSEVYWKLDNGNIIVTKEPPEIIEEEPNTLTVDGWTLVKSKPNTTISKNGVYICYNDNLQLYMTGTLRQPVIKQGSLHEVLEYMRYTYSTIPPEELLQKIHE